MSAHALFSTPVFIGTLPPPFTGRTIATAKIIDALAKQGPVSVYNVSIARRLSSRLFVPMKFIRSIGAFIFLLVQPCAASRSFYLVANHARGLWYDILLALIARAKGFTIFLHHHVYIYIRQRDFRMALLSRILGAEAVHLVLSEKMARDFAQLYGASRRFLTLPNSPPAATHRPEHRPRERKPGSAITLGHLSNLTLEKGLESVIESFKVTHRRWGKVRLILGGPAVGAAATELIEETLRAFPKNVEHRGPVYEDDKIRFFSEVDVFLFPTRYQNEAQPLVLIEALQSGIPIIAYGMGCIPDLLKDCAGAVVVDPSRDFPATAAAALSVWINDAEQYRHAARSTLDHADKLARTSERQLTRFLALLRHPKDGNVDLAAAIYSGDELQISRQGKST